MKAQELSPCPEETGVVKSAIRTLEILEYFDEVQQPLNIVAVATALDYPQSSTAALLRSLTTMGYLHYNSRKLTYVPTRSRSLSRKLDQSRLVSRGWVEIGFSIPASCRVGGLPRHGLEIYVEHSPERRHADADDESVLHGNYSPAVKRLRIINNSPVVSNRFKMHRRHAPCAVGKPSHPQNSTTKTLRQSAQKDHPCPTRSAFQASVLMIVWRWSPDPAPE